MKNEIEPWVTKVKHKFIYLMGKEMVMKSKRNKNIKIMLLHGSMLMLVFMLGMIPGTLMKTRAATYSEELVCSDNVPQQDDLISSPIIFKPDNLDIRIKKGTCCDKSHQIIDGTSDFIDPLPYERQAILTDETGALYKDSIAEANILQMEPSLIRWELRIRKKAPVTITLIQDYCNGDRRLFFYYFTFMVIILLIVIFLYISFPAAVAFTLIR